MGPLSGTTVIEIKGIGPGPYAGMLMADLGADVIVVERASTPSGLGLPAQYEVTSRGKRSIALDLKNPDGLATLMRLIASADVLIEGFRPGVAERLGFGPGDCHEINPALVYGRLTGWGQHGPLSQTAGHDINYIALIGALAAIGTKAAPVPPLNLVGDYAGGSLFLVIGVLAALLVARQSGQGQVVDAAITDGAAHLMSPFYGWHNAGGWQRTRETNIVDGGNYFYGVYETSDGKHVAVGPLEPQFYAQFIELGGFDPAVFGQQAGPGDWAEKRALLAEQFRTRTQQEWCETFADSDACVAPVLDFVEATEHTHNVARETYIDLNGHKQPAPAPRFSRSACVTPAAPASEGGNSADVLKAYGFSPDDIAALRESGALS